MMQSLLFHDKHLLLPKMLQEGNPNLTICQQIRSMNHATVQMVIGRIFTSLLIQETSFLA
jgi:hypothetical protein